MQNSGTQPGQWVNVTGSGNNVAVGTGARAGNTSVGGSGETPDAATLLAQIRALAANAPDRAAGEQAEAAAAAIEADLAKPQSHRFSLGSALSALSKLTGNIPQITQLVDALTTAIHTL